MKSITRILSLLAATLTALSFPGIASGETIGVNFLRGGNDGGTNGNVLAATDLAGASINAQVNWNNVAGALGTNVALVDSAGATTTIAASWASPNTWSQTTPNNLGTPDLNLMNAYLDNNGNANVAIANPFNMFSTTDPVNANRNWPLVYLTGLQAWMAAEGVSAYDVVIYFDGDNNGGRTGEYWAVNASGDPAALTVGVDASTHVFGCDLNNFANGGSQVYSEVLSSIQTGALPNVSGGLIAEYGNFPGNFTVIQSLTSDTVLLRSQRFNSRAVINAIQVLPRATVLPATVYAMYDAPVYAGGMARFAPTVAGGTPMTFQWQKNGAPLTDGGNISGSTTATLQISSASAADVASYALVVTNPLGVITSAPAALTIVTPVGNSYAEKIYTSAPYAYWRFNELLDPTTGFTPAYEYVGGYTATYGIAAQNGAFGVVGPAPSDWPGFESGNLAYQSSRAARQTYLMAPPLNLNTNTVTMCAWIYPTVAQASATALLSSRNGSDVGTFGFGSYYGSLGYTWNSNSAATYQFIPGSAGYPQPLIPPTNSWSFVALTVSPSNAILYLYNTSGQLTATNAITHTIQGLTGITFLGSDAIGAGIAAPQNRAFVGSIDEVSVFNRTLSADELTALYKKGVGASLLPTTILQQPQPLALMEGRPAKFSVQASGEGTLSYQWRKNNGNLADAGTISGALSPTLNISAVAMSDDADYDVVVTGTAGPITSVKAHLTVVATNAAPSPYQAAVQKANPIAFWRMNEVSGTTANDYWGGNIAQHNPSVILGADGPQSPAFLGLETTNRAAQYDGFGAGTSSSSSFLNNRGQFSVIGWFNTPAQLQQNRAGLFGQNDVCEFGFHGTATLEAQQVGVWTPRAAAYLSVTNLIPDQWYLIAAVGSGTSINLYLVSTNNGVTILQANTTHTATTSYGQSVFPFRMGGDGILDASANYFTGLIDEVAVFDRALTADELAGLLATALTGSELAPPTISIQPTPSTTLYAGRTAQLSVTAVGLGLKYQWRLGGLPINDAGNVSGTKTNTITLSNLIAGNAGDYDVVITNSVGSVTSSIASLFVISPSPGGYEAAVIAANPLAYYRLGELDDPSSGTVTAFDYLGGHNGTYGAAAQNGFNSIAGPLAPAWKFETTNTAVLTTGGTADTWVNTAFGSLSTNTVTFTMWVFPIGDQDTRAGLLVSRGGTAAGGMGYNGQMLSYTWNNNNAATYNFPSDLVIPSNQWSFVAMVIEPTQATLYLGNTNGWGSAVNAIAHTSDVFGTWMIGHDSNTSTTTRTFNGVIDEVAVFTRSLSRSEVEQLFTSAGGTVPATAITLNIQKVGDMVVLDWSSGTLLQADEATGPWTTNTAASPFTNAPSGDKKFYRVIVQ